MLHHFFVLGTLGLPTMTQHRQYKPQIVIKPITGRGVVERRVGDEVKPLDVVDVRVERLLLSPVGGSIPPFIWC